MRSSPVTTRRVAWALGVPMAATVLAFVVPLGLDLLLSGPQRYFDYLAADAFYYLTVARNAAQHGSFSFDQLHGTNGYHPLWQWLLGLHMAGAHALGLSESTALVLCLALGAGFIASALLLLARCATVDEAHVSPLFVLTPAGVLAVLCAPWWFLPGIDAPSKVRPLVGTLWGYVNGMESGLAILCFAGLATMYCRGRPLESRARALAFGALLALLTLARLDHGVFAVSAAALLVHTARSDGKPSTLRRAGWAIGLFALALGGYVLGNRIVYGVALPVSGTLKTTFPAITGINLQAIDTLLTRPPEHWLGTTARLAQLLVPAVFALGYLPYALTMRQQAEGWRRWLPHLRPGLAPFEIFLLNTAFGVLALATYNLLYVPLNAQGHWYFPVSTLFVSLFAWVALARHRWARWLTGSPARWLAWHLAACALVGAFFIHVRRPGGARTMAWLYFEEAPRLRAHYRSAALPERPRLLSFDDGIVAFATGWPTLSGYGLNLDVEALKHQQQGQLLELAYRRGFERLTGLQYFDCLGLTAGSGQADFFPLLRTKLRDEELHQFRFAVEYRSPSGRFCIIRARRTDAPQ